MGGIVWLASYPKSGNTWVRLFLDSLLGGDRPLRINAPRRFSVGEASMEWYRRASGLPPMAIDRRRAIALRPQVQACIAGLAAGGILAKTHSAHVRFERTPLFSPAATAAAVYIVRNPFDVAVSFAHHTGQDIDRTIAVMDDDRSHLALKGPNVNEFISSWTTHVTSWTRRRHPRLLVVRYEDMLEAPGDAFQRIARHVGLRPSREEVEGALARCRFESLQAQESAEGFGEAPEGRTFFRRGTAEQWRDVLSGAQVARLAAAHGHAMGRLGYRPEGVTLPDQPPPRPRGLLLDFECGVRLEPPVEIPVAMQVKGYAIGV